MKILGIRVDSVDMIESLSRIAELIKSKKPSQVVTLNAEILYNAQDDEKTKTVIEHAAMVTPDGAGILWAASKLGHPLKERVTGIDLLQELCRQAPYNGWKLYFLGAAPQVAQTAAAKLREQNNSIQIVGTHDGYFNKEEEKNILADIADKKPDLLFVAMGAPRQDIWIYDHQDELPPLVAIGVGGSLDVLAGIVKRAPASFQRLKLEWLWRLLKQPSRIGRMMALPKFVIAVNKSRRKSQKIQAEMKRRRLP
ncbi:MAG: WecB/TagA/CpsF family glycosyltransferase [Clostridia bacterium]|nr:WecB/TagA/CpsF family glycosyltransferase [Clostridia bacterium]